jgi:transposase-like protein
LLDLDELTSHDCRVNRGTAMARTAPPQPIHELTIAEFNARFTDEDACKRYLMQCRWPEGVRCPRCGNDDVHHLAPSKPFHWQCHRCNSAGYRFSVLVGTIFQNKHRSLLDWLRVIHLMLRGERLVSIQQVVRFGSRATASAMCRRVCEAASDRDLHRLGGIVSPEFLSKAEFYRTAKGWLWRRSDG